MSAPENDSAEKPTSARRARFPKGRGGNAKGRPQKIKIESSDDLLSFRVSTGDKRNRVPLTEALLHNMADRAGNGDVHAFKQLMKIRDRLRQKTGLKKPQPSQQIHNVIVYPTECEPLLETLGILRQVPSVYSAGFGQSQPSEAKIETWVIEAAVRYNPKLIHSNELELLSWAAVDSSRAEQLIPRKTKADEGRQ